MPEPLPDWFRHYLFFLLPVVVALAAVRGRGRRETAIGRAAAEAVDWTTAVPAVPPAVATVVVRGWPGRAAVLATILDLARRGHLRVADERIDRAGSSDPLLSYEGVLLDAIFDGGTRAAATRADLAGRLPRRIHEVRAAIEAEAAARGLVEAHPRQIRRRAALWFGGFAGLAVIGMAFSVALAAGAFVAALVVALSRARLRRTAAGEAEAGRLRAWAQLLARKDALAPERAAALRPYGVALGVGPAGLDWLAPLLDPPAAERSAGEGGRDGGARGGGGGYGATGGASGGGGASRGW